MSELLESYVVSIISFYIEFYVWNKLLNRNYKLFSISTIMLILFLSVFSTVNYYVNAGFFRIVVITFIAGLAIKYFFKVDFKTGFGVAIFTQIIMAISEMIFTLFVANIKKLDMNEIKKMYFAKVFSNLAIAIITFLLMQITSVKKVFTNALRVMNSTDKKYLITVLLTLIFSVNFLCALLYYQINITLLILVTTIIIFVYTFITLKIIITQDANAKMKIEYESLLDKSVEYEKIIDKSRRDTHENKNDLIILDSLISNRSKKAKNQIKAMIDDYDKIEKDLRGNDNLYRRTLAIPSGGLRGLIYHKLLLCDELGINYDLRVGRDINSKSLKNVNFNKMRQFVKIVGVYLDNAIQAVKELETKEIDVEVYIEEGNFCILVANNFQGELDVDKLGTMGYSSKGGNHGYGLALAKEILMQNKEITSETSIYMDIMTQVIKIKM